MLQENKVGDVWETRSMNLKHTVTKSVRILCRGVSWCKKGHSQELAQKKIRIIILLQILTVFWTHKFHFDQLEMYFVSIQS